MALNASEANLTQSPEQLKLICENMTRDSNVRHEMPYGSSVEEQLKLNNQEGF